MGGARDIDSPDLFPDLPPGVVSIVERLRGAGHAAYLVGGCVRDRSIGRDVSDFDVTTDAGSDELLALFPRAIPIGRHHGTVMQPTPDGPVDVTVFRGGGSIERDLERRDFTVNAIAYDPSDGRLIDPFGGRDDLAHRRLRSVGSADDRFGEDPLRALRGVRLTATLGLEPQSDLPAAMSRARKPLGGVARERVRHEVEQLVLGEYAERGLGLLRETGIEADLAPGVRDDAAAVVARVPAILSLRLAAWLRDTRAERILVAMRFPRRTVARVAHLLRQHPLGAGVNPRRDVAVRRMIRRAGESDLSVLFALRRAELAVGGGETAPVDAVEAAVERVRRAGALALRRFDLAIDGRAVMEALGRGPGPHVGRALRYLTERVIEDPDQNEPDRLRALLTAWNAEREGD